MLDSARLPFRIDSIHDPRNAIMSVTHPQMTLTNLWHATGGLYIWEYFTTLDYEWRIFRGQMPYRWSTWAYSFARLAALVSIVLSFVVMDVTSPINCQLWVLFSTIFLCLASATAALLIVIRTIAIWNRNKVVIALASTVWLAGIVFHLLNIIQLVHYEWVSTHRACEPVKNDHNSGFIPAIITDVILLLIILAGLFIMRRDGGGVLGLTRLIWKQGIIWLVLGSAIEVPSLVFTALHINDQFHHVFETPSQIVMLIAATRMHRSLIDLSSNDIPENPLLVHTAFEKYSTGPTSDINPSSTINTSKQMPIFSALFTLNSARAPPSPLLTISPYPIPETGST